MSDIEKMIEMVKDVGVLRGMYDQVCDERDKLKAELEEMKAKAEKLAEALKYIEDKGKGVDEMTEWAREALAEFEGTK